MEEVHNARAQKLLEIAAMLEDARPSHVAICLETLAAVYYGMSLAIFVAPTTDHFITSDSPTVRYNPEAHRWPPLAARKKRAPPAGGEGAEKFLPSLFGDSVASEDSKQAGSSRS